MKKRILYQTLEERHNNAVVEANGPGFCRNEKAWLCEGYYFWETKEETAKWWGYKVYANSFVKKGFIICKTSYDYGADNFFDLVGDTGHRQDFWDAVREVEISYPGESFTAAFVLAFLREDDEFSKRFWAVRAYPIQSRTGLRKIYFADQNPAYMEENAPIQLCVWNNIDRFLQDPFVVVGNYPYQRKWISVNS